MKFTRKKKLDQYPPYLQIEPSSICNYRCIFCYQTTLSFSNKKIKSYGYNEFRYVQKYCRSSYGNIEFLSLASRGEPLICKDFNKMMEYSIGKFLNLKVNTNASLLTEKKCHSLLCGGAKTIVFSADAAEEPLYSKLRVRGKLDKVLRNIELFQKIRETNYKNNKIISRVSGVLVEKEQNMESMKQLWGGLVDQISFVKYNPWENVYSSPMSNVTNSCSDLWRRMFIWFDGKINPCDTDYKSVLEIANISQNKISEAWQSKNYGRLRSNHILGKREKINPCNRCTVV